MTAIERAASNDYCGEGGGGGGSASSSLAHHPPNHRFGSMIIPFTIGGFLYIALVGIVPEIIEEKDKRVSFLQMSSFLVGIVFIYSLIKIEALLPLLFL